MNQRLLSRHLHRAYVLLCTLTFSVFNLLTQYYYVPSYGDMWVMDGIGYRTYGGNCVEVTLGLDHTQVQEVSAYDKQSVRFRGNKNLGVWKIQITHF